MLTNANPRSKHSLIFLLPSMGNLCLLLRSPLDRAGAESQALLAPSPPVRPWLLTCSDLIEGDGLSHPPSQRHAHPLQQLFLGEEVLLSWKDLREPESRVCPRGYGNLQCRAAPSAQPSFQPRQHRENRRRLTCPVKFLKSYGADLETWPGIAVGHHPCTEGFAFSATDTHFLLKKLGGNCP